MTDAAAERPRRHGSAGEPLRLAWVIDSLVTGGAERLAVTFAEEAVSRPNLDLTVFTLSDADTPFRRAIEALGVPVVALPGRSLVDPARFLRLVRELRHRRIEMVHAHLTSSTTLAGAAAALLRLPFATTVHNVQPSTRRVSKARQFVYRSILRRQAVRRIAVGKAVAAANAADAGGGAFAVVPNAVAPSAVWRGDDRERTRAELGISEGELAVIAVGALIGQKAYPDMLRAFRSVAPAVPAARLLIVGAILWKEVEEELRQGIAEDGLADRVRLLGMRQDVPRLLAASDLYLSSSHWEGAPVALLEAMANGLPCVVTSVGDNPLTLDGTGAWLTPPGDPAAQAAALLEALRDPEARRRCAEAVERRALEDFGVAAWVDRHLALYAEQTRRRDWLQARGGTP